MISRFVLQSLSKDKLSVFLFHKVPQQCDPLVPADLDMARFEYLLNHRFPSCTYCRWKRPLAVCRQAPCHAALPALRFDDGYPDWLAGVAPALRRRNLHATFFITSGQFDGVPLWHERILAAVRRLSGSLDMGIPFLPAQPVASIDDRRRQVQRLEQELKPSPFTAASRFCSSWKPKQGCILLTCR